jgi:hypothetical protein
MWTGDMGSPSTDENWLGNLPEDARESRTCPHFVEREPVANEEHLAVLRQGTEAWNGWRERNPDKKPDLGEGILSGAHLSGADLREADLSVADLREADLSGANLSAADLSMANVSGANLSMAGLCAANLGAADLIGANLRGADLIFANLTMANLTLADLTEASLFETVFADVDLTDTNGLNECSHEGPSVIDFRTLSQNDNLPLPFLRGCGLPDNLIDYLPSLRGDAIKFCSCFISYSNKDQVFAKRLHADLQNKGVRCWFAPHDLPIGAKTWDAIDEAIRLRDKLLLILSKASIVSGWVEEEVNKAYAEEGSRGEVVLFPIRIDDEVMSTTKPWAGRLRNGRNIGDFRGWETVAEYQKSLDRLLRDLKASGEN